MVASSPFPRHPPVYVGEMRAMLEGIRLARHKGWMDVLLEGDCAQVVTAIQSATPDRFADFGALLDEVFAVSSLFSCFRVSFVKRTGN